MKPEQFKKAYDLLIKDGRITIHHPIFGDALVTLNTIAGRSSLTVDWLTREGDEVRPPTKEANEQANALVASILQAGGVDITGLQRQEFHSKEEREKFLFRMHGGGKG